MKRLSIFLLAALALLGAGCETGALSNINTPVTSQVYQATTTVATAPIQDNQVQPQEAPSYVVFDRTMAQGSSGTEIASLQQFLAYEGLYQGDNSGIFDQATVSAVMAFERQQSILPADGIFGPVEARAAHVILSQHPDWVTFLSNDNGYKNVNGSDVHSPSYSTNGIPAGASARCNDGTYSFSMHRSGTCSHHGGVEEWY